MQALDSTTTHYPVEISGWDVEHNFFVEKTTLEWIEKSCRTIFTRRRLQQGTLLFVRLIGPRLNAHPLPYRVNNTQARGARGWHRVELEQMRGEDQPAPESTREARGHGAISS